MPADSGNNYSRNIISILLAASVIGLFIFYRKEVSDAFEKIRISWVVLGLTCFLINYFFRAARLHRIDQENNCSLSRCGLLFESAWVCNLYAPYASRRTFPSIHFKIDGGYRYKRGC